MISGYFHAQFFGLNWSIYIVEFVHISVYLYILHDFGCVVNVHATFLLFLKLL